MTERSRGVLVNPFSKVGQCWAELCFLMFADSCGVDTPTMANFKLPKWYLSLNTELGKNADVGAHELV